MGCELAHLAQRAVLQHVSRERRTLAGGGQRDKLVDDLIRREIQRRMAHFLEEATFERDLEPSSFSQKGWFPLPRAVDFLETAVVQLVTEVQCHCGVVPFERVVVGRGQGPDLVHPA
jgi:hypothetical protein